MSEDDKLIDLNAERAKRVHDLNDKRLNEVRQAFEQAMPLGKVKKKTEEQAQKALKQPASIDAGQLLPFFTPRRGRH
ncbi:hypothetical protein HT121_02035 [Pseudomonas sp. MAFF 301514]|uniref:hypothetical protein n=1 Tax=Pseudomonas allii TaxID=2740531 RepID=UPI0015B8047F|nr:hypothetical protein [Pseudomonas allii]NWN46506.1 hypothetical protein [Pseudomonas allii]